MLLANKTPLLNPSIFFLRILLCSLLLEVVPFLQKSFIVLALDKLLNFEMMSQVSRTALH
jgi:hypothetical protein